MASREKTLRAWLLLVATGPALIAMSMSIVIWFVTESAGCFLVYFVIVLALRGALFVEAMSFVEAVREAIGEVRKAIGGDDVKPSTRPPR